MLIRKQSVTSTTSEEMKNEKNNIRNDIERKSETTEMTKDSEPKFFSKIFNLKSFSKTKMKGADIKKKQDMEESYTSLTDLFISKDKDKDKDKDDFINIIIFQLQRITNLLEQQNIHLKNLIALKRKNHQIDIISKQKLFKNIFK